VEGASLDEGCESKSFSLHVSLFLLPLLLCVAQDALFRDYGEFLSSMRGAYVAAEDAGVLHGGGGLRRCV
jgi:hypothetical protein